MQTHRVAAVALALSCAFLTVSCVRSPEADEPGEATGEAPSSAGAESTTPTEPSSMDAEHTGEAEGDLTKAECYEQYKSQLRDCVRKPAGEITWCGMVAGMVFAGCLRLAED
jgi:hypothetical protein